MTRILTHPPNIKDVARQAGVSYQTVSRVLNHHPSVAPATRQRVEHVIQTLNYRPSNAARELVAKRNATLGVVSFGVTQFGPAQMLSNLENTSHRAGYRLSSISVSRLSTGEISAAIQELRSQRVAGIILITPLLHVDAAPIHDLCRDLPFLLIGAEPKARQPVLAFDQFIGGWLAAQHLIQLGHHDIALLSGPPTWYDAVQRRQGWLGALQQVGLTPICEAEGDWTAAGGYQQTHTLLDQHCSFTALLAANDQMALGAVKALKERHLSVPNDVSIVGFDDLPESEYFDPPLSTVRQDFNTLCTLAISQVLHLIDPDSPKPDPAILVPTLIVRESAILQP